MFCLTSNSKLVEKSTSLSNLLFRIFRI